MPRLTPVTWRDMVARLRARGFDGPFQGGKHPYMVKGDLVLTIPNPHKESIGPDLLNRVLKQAGIDRNDWLQDD